MLKWEEHADEPGSLRWIVLIAYLMGLSIGVHILNLLTIPALAFIYYFRRTERTTLKGIGVTFLVGCAVLVVINNLIIPYSVWVGAMVDVFFVNVLGLPVNSGMAVFALALIGGMGYLAWRAHTKGHVVWNTLLLSVTMILVGYSSYASVTIRAAANPPMNPITRAIRRLCCRCSTATSTAIVRWLWGPISLLRNERTTTSTAISSIWARTASTAPHGCCRDTSMIRNSCTCSRACGIRARAKVTNSGPPTAPKSKRCAMRTVKSSVTNRAAPNVASCSISAANGSTATNTARRRPSSNPRFLENLNYFFNYQLSYMYWRYFLWNFVGRQSDIQPVGSTITDGNWLSGIKWIDRHFTGPQDDLPHEIAENKGRNTYYFLPFLLGLIGLLYQLNRDQRNFSIVMILFIMTGIALVFYFNTSPGEPRERDYVYAGSFYAFSIWIGLGVLAVREFFARLARRNTTAVAVAATVVCMGVPAILCAENWDDHDRSHRYMARDIGWNYLMSTLPNSIILNYGDNDTFPLWNNQEVYGVRPDVRIMNTSYLGGEWYIDEMKTRANDAAGIRSPLPKHKYTYMNDWVPVSNRIDRPVELKEVIDFIRNDDPRTQLRLDDGTDDGERVDYIPTKQLALPVNKENVIASGIVREADRDKMVDTIYFSLTKSAIDKSQLMLLDMLAHFDWKRPIFMTQPYMFYDLGLADYLQFDGYAYRFVPIRTPVKSVAEMGRIDPDYAAPLLRDTFRYGNLADPRVNVDYFLQYNLNASHARAAFARVAKALLEQNRVDEAVELLDLGLERLPTSQIRFTANNTYPFLEAYYAAGVLGAPDAIRKGDALLLEYAHTIIEYIEYYLRFEGVQADMVASELTERLKDLGDVYYLASYAGRNDIVRELNEYYRSLGVVEEDLADVGDRPQPVDADTLLD